MLHKMRLVSVLLVLLLSVSAVFAQDGEWPRTLVDGLGTEVTIAEAPQNIASVSLGADEVLLPLIGPERFVGVTQLALDPAISNVAGLAAQVPNAIAAASDTEFIISLQPDIVFVASFTDQAVIQQLHDAGLTVFATTFAIGVQPVQDNIRLLGQAVGAEDAAEDMIADMDAQIAAVADAVGTPATPVRALYLTPGNYTSGQNSTISEIIAAAGGVDVAATVEQFAPVTDEFIIEQNPDVILLSGWTPWDATFVDTFKNNPAFADLSAVQNGQVYVAHDAHLTTVSQFLAEGVEDVAAYLYPESYPAFPVTVTDAAGNVITVDERPDVVLLAPQDALDAPQDRILANMSSPVEVFYIGDDLVIDPASIDVAFINAADLEAAASALEDVENVVVLYDEAIPANVVANITLIGEVMGERVVALESSAIYTDALEAQAAQ
jgi:iron complex transport system substrate-binding protein